MNTIYIENFNGVLGHVDKIDNLSTGSDTVNISNKNSENIYKEKSTVNKICIELNENNEILNKEEFENKIQEIIQHTLEDRAFKICLKPTKYLHEYENSKALSSKNLFYKNLLDNKKLIQKCENIANASIHILIKKDLYQLFEIELIIKGIIEYYRKDISEYKKISFAFPNNELDCYRTISLNEVHGLEKIISKPFTHIGFDSGYDIHDLPHNVKYTKALPTILFKMNDKNIDFNDIENYIHLKIASN